MLKPATPRDPVSAKKVARRLNKVPMGNGRGRVSAAVVDIGSGKLLYDRGAGTPLIPASTNKLLTSAAVLSLLGPEHRFTTRVVQAKPGSVVLVGGGDPYLAARTARSQYPERASVADLAVSTAKALKSKKQRKVAVGYDASLFSGPAWNPVWPAGYADQVTATSALWVNEGRLAGSPGPRVSDPAGQAARVFVSALRGQGITVSAVKPAKAAKGAAQLAAVRSMPVERVVEQLLLVSDNDAAEVMFRQAAVAARRPGSITAAQRTVHEQLTKLGVWRKGLATSDGSGLARQTKVPATTMVKLLRLAAQAKHPELRALITGLPVAGVEGSLRSKYSDDDTLAARGLVRGKTGTLNKVHSLAGFVRTTDGEMFVYAFLVNDAQSDFGAKVWLDKVSAALGGCGCR